MKKSILLLGLISILFLSCSNDCDWESQASLFEKEQIINRVNELFIETDSRNWDKVKECFTDSVSFDMTSLAGGQPSIISSQNIVDAWDSGLKTLKAIHHQVGNYMVTITDNKADAFCYGIASHYLPNKTDRNIRTFVGSYDIHLVKLNKSWKIDGFKFNIKYIDGNPNLEKDI